MTTTYRKIYLLMPSKRYGSELLADYTEGDSHFSPQWEAYMAAGTKEARASYTIVAKKSVLGAKVINSGGEDMGKIEDLVIDTRNNRVAYAILSFGGLFGMGDKHFAIPFEAFAFDLSEKVAVLNVDQDRLSNAPGFDKDNWPDMSDTGWSTTLHRHYGYKPYWDESATEVPPGRSL